MNPLIAFGVGVLVGVLFGIFIHCLLQIARESRDTSKVTS